MVEIRWDLLNLFMEDFRSFLCGHAAVCESICAPVVMRRIRSQFLPERERELMVCCLWQWRCRMAEWRLCSRGIKWVWHNFCRGGVVKGVTLCNRGGGGWNVQRKCDIIFECGTACSHISCGNYNRRYAPVTDSIVILRPYLHYRNNAIYTYLLTAWWASAMLLRFVPRRGNRTSLWQPRGRELVARVWGANECDLDARVRRGSKVKDHTPRQTSHSVQQRRGKLGVAVRPTPASVLM